MKTPPLHIIVLLTIATAFVLASGSARAQAILSFSGGSGTPSSLTLAQPVTYTITAAGAPVFLFQNAGNLLGYQYGASGNITFTINGGPSQFINTMDSGFVGVNVTANDVIIFGAIPGLSVGDVVQLSAGTLTTTGNVFEVAPANGSFTTFLVDGYASTALPISTNGVAIPEPSTYALLAVGCAGLLALRRRK